MSPFVVMNLVLDMVSLGLSVEEVKAKVAQLEAAGVTGSALSLKLTEMRDAALAKAQHDIDSAP